MNSSRSSMSPEPLSLLELLYQREHGFMMDCDDSRNFYGSSALLPLHSSDSALHLQLPSTFKLSNITRNSRLGNVVRQSSLRSRTCSMSPERALSLPREAAPLYIKYLKEQNEMGTLPSRHSRSLSLRQGTSKSTPTKDRLLDSSTYSEWIPKMDITNRNSAIPLEIVPNHVSNESSAKRSDLVNNGIVNTTTSFVRKKLDDTEEACGSQVCLNQVPDQVSTRFSQMQVKSNQVPVQPVQNQSESSQLLAHSNEVPSADQYPVKSNQLKPVYNSITITTTSPTSPTKAFPATEAVVDRIVITQKNRVQGEAEDLVTNGMRELESGSEGNRSSAEVIQLDLGKQEGLERECGKDGMVQDMKRIPGAETGMDHETSENSIQDIQKRGPAWSSVTITVTSSIQPEDKSSSVIDSHSNLNGSTSRNSSVKGRSVSCSVNGRQSITDNHTNPMCGVLTENNVHAKQNLSRSVCPGLLISSSDPSSPRMRTRRKAPSSALSVAATAPTRRHSSLSPRPQFALSASPEANRRFSCNLASLPLSWNPGEHSALFPNEMYRIPSAPVRRQLHTISNGVKVRAKPSMILVFTGDNEDLFNRISATLTTMIPLDTLTIFHLSYEALCKHPWIGRDAACLIVADTAHLDDKCWTRLQQYFNNSGKMLFLCQNNLLASLSACDTSKKSAKLLKMAFGERQSKKLGKDFENFLKKTLKALHKDKTVNQTFHAKDPVGGYKYSVVLSKNEGSPLLLYMENAAQQASALFSDATSEQLLNSGTTLIADALSRLSIKITKDAHMPALTQGYFICEYDRMPWDMEGMRFNEKFGTRPKLLLKQIRKHGALPDASRDLLPIEVRTRAEHLPDFDEEIYFKGLKTSRLGKALFYIPVCETTMDIGSSLAIAMPEEPVAIIARRQIKARGRTGNQWLSPVGCATFSFNYTLPAESPLGKNVGFIQHIFCVAVAEGICTLNEELEDFPLRIKWPNDLYYERKYKMGGLLVNATTVGGNIVCTLGCGLNLSNSKPTICINDFLPDDLKIRHEDYFANTLNKFEYYVNMYQNDGQDEFLKHYYRLWLHSREEVTLSDTNEKAVIRGLGYYGFLEVRSRQTGQIMAVHPDGNTFDMMKGLITAKYA